ncbi:phosphate regulon sensor histidine kinase PhoR [Candidatus Symbiobacter mobilis]|uniref:Phosphate regulon sensor protein PhoR n=1 Tax=Candidatus Symbiobacter mobilis CR TaxID=946483 RepID=U5N657_9BURK|nr:phosphate regulon sensor histidine kinase PhoR [Candidatus Symbiobacter mobilis]AGX86775.1 signal transduction histidine kinase PhoR [Candidatus Symbiobacter mobilis CR]
MLARPLSLLALQMLGAFAGWWAGHWLGREHCAWWGGWFATMVWVVVDTVRARNVIDRLRAGRGLIHANPAQGSGPGGMWGDVLDRIVRCLRVQEQEIAECQSRLEHFLAAFQASPNGVVLLDVQQRIDWCNQRACVHFGLDAQRDIGQAISHLVRDPEFLTFLTDAHSGRELVMPARAQASQHPISLSVQAYPYAQGKWLLLSRDVTTDRRSQAMRREFLANVAHEIRTPLTVLSGFVETLQTLEPNKAERQRCLVWMEKQTLRMRHLVEDLLVLSSLEEQSVPTTRTRNDVRSLLDQVVADAHALSAGMGEEGKEAHQIDCIASAPVYLEGNTQELLSAMGNLVGNAVRYTPAGGSITVSAVLQDDGTLEFAVRDTGYGIAAEHIPRLTERFYRVDRGRSRSQGGTGLGLAIVAQIAHRHGATLGIDSTVGKGSTFKLVFPANLVYRGQDFHRSYNV